MLWSPGTENETKGLFTAMDRNASTGHRLARTMMLAAKLLVTETAVTQDTHWVPCSDSSNRTLTGCPAKPRTALALLMLLTAI